MRISDWSSDVCSSDLVAALLFAGAYGVWFYLSNQGTSLGDLVAPVPAELQEMVDDAPSSSPSAVLSSAAPAAPQAESPVSQPQATADRKSTRLNSSH